MNLGEVFLVRVTSWLFEMDKIGCFDKGISLKIILVVYSQIVFEYSLVMSVFKANGLSLSFCT